jgi:hypothetical protein
VNSKQSQQKGGKVNANQKNQKLEPQQSKIKEPKVKGKVSKQPQTQKTPAQPPPAEISKKAKQKNVPLPEKTISSPEHKPVSVLTTT